MQNVLFIIIAILLIGAALFLILRKPSGQEGSTMNEGQNQSNTSAQQGLSISTEAFEHEGEISERYGCDAEGVNPALSISGVSENARSLVLIAEDPDAPVGNFVHWVKWNIDPSTSVIEEGDESFGVSGTTSAGDTGYVAPCPPDGEHRYFYRLYALDTTLDLEQGAGREDVAEAMEGHVLQQTEIMGRFAR